MDVDNDQEQETQRKLLEEEANRAMDHENVVLGGYGGF